MALDLVWHHTHFNRAGAQYEYRVLKVDDATVVSPVDATFVTNQVQTDTVLTGAAVGSTFVIVGSLNNDGRYTITAIDEGGGGAPYVNLYDVTPTPGTLEVDTSGFTVRVENSSLVDASQTVSLFKWGEENSDKYKEIQRSYCDLFLIADSGLQYQDFFTSAVGSYYLEVYKGGGLWWVGVGITDQYLESLLPPPYEVRLTFSDGTELANSIRYYTADPNARFNLAIALSEGLAATSISLPITETINVYESQMNMADQDSPLDQCQIDPEAWYQEGGFTFGSSLTDIAAFFGARIFQEDGGWYIERVNEYSGDRLQRYFTAAGVWDSFAWDDTTTTITTIKGETGDLTLLPLAKNLSITLSEERTNFIENAFFEKWDGGLTTPLNWTNSSLNLTRVADGQSGRYSMQIDNGNIAANFIEAAIKLDSTPATHLFNEDTSYNLVFNVMPDDDARISYSLKFGNFWMDGVGGWSASEVKITHSYSDNASFSQFQKVSISLDLTGSGNTGSDHLIILRIFGGIGNGSTYDYVTITDPRGFRGDAATVIRDSESAGGDKALQLRLKSGTLGESPLNTANRLVVYNSTSTDPNQDWERRGVTEALGTDDILLDAYNDELSVNQMRLNMTLVDVNIKIRRPIVVPALGNKRFISNGVTFDPSLNEWSGEWIEIVSTPKYTQLPPP